MNNKACVMHPTYFSLDLSGSHGQCNQGRWDCDENMEKLPRGLLCEVSCRRLRGRSHRSVVPLSVNISDCNGVKSSGPTSISKHNPQQFHGWNRTESLV